MKLRPKLTFPESKLDVQKHPISTLGHTIKARTIAEAYPEVIYRILTNGLLVPNAQGSYFKELLDCKIITTEDDPNNFNHPDYLPFNVEYRDRYIKQLITISKDTTTYTYGDRLKGQIDKVINQLSKDIATTRAVMSLWLTSSDGEAGSPCLVTIIVKTEKNKLYLTAIFRSNDMFSAWPANAMQLRYLQNYIKLGINNNGYDLELGALTTISNSAHIYEQALVEAYNLIPIYKKLSKKPKDYNDPIGNFSLIGEDLILYCDGVGINSYNIKTNTLYDILVDYPNIEKTHLIYLSQFFK